MKTCFIICWFGNLPDYFPVWAKTCSYNKDFDFLIFTDAQVRYNLPPNIKHIKFTLKELLKRIENKVFSPTKLTKPYRVCDFRPMYGIIFANELAGYDFWGYCDIDVVFGDLSKFLSAQDFQRDAILNGGHFTLIRNCDSMNELYKKDGALFSYKTVASKEAIYAFDETTGIHRIARRNKVNARYGIPYIEALSKYTQLRSRMSAKNPDTQAFYWEDGCLYRVKEEDNHCFYQEIAYIHLQKRELGILDETLVKANSFWVTPKGFVTKVYYGKPNSEDISKFNPDEGEEKRRKEKNRYNKNKIITILKRNPFQIYVRIRQQFAGINGEDGTGEEQVWIEY